MQTEAAFGVGCIVPEVVGAKDVEEWKSGVHATLEAIPAIRDLELENISRGFAPKSGITPWGESKEFTPEAGVMKFRITIPSRVQSGLRASRKVGDTEDFIVRTYFNHRHPVTFVICDGADASLRTPSMSLVVVREFLKREIGKLQGDQTRIRKLGPSPFHGNFYLAAGSQGEQLVDGISVDVKERPGYHDFRFCYEQGSTSLGNALEFVFAWLIPEISAFYRVKIDSAKRMKRATSTVGLAEGLADTYAQRGVIAYFRRVFRNKRDLLGLRLSLLQAKLTAVNELRADEDLISSVYADRSVRIIHPYTHKGLSETFEAELETAEKTLDILESQHTQEVQRVTTFCASLLGVVVGALLTAWLRR
ncbi:hypothetical protein HUT18_04910 [Streptomyces sp. NA04227]|uniref:hypothetical protein n=1 Tax=Streptomyces sp. NA04227 TaxID=2742136 RepID=UPI0015913DCC|nr:hypothetical protein [Streptomyces sp. NA04227]QKW05820.1 hypothetical protein HUT18_04910 [Streptomyces sp. NA04227]